MKYKYLISLLFINNHIKIKSKWVGRFSIKVKQLLITNCKHNKIYDKRLKTRGQNLPTVDIFLMINLINYIFINFSSLKL